MSKRFVWPNMRSDIAKFVRNCLQCQRSKVGRHNKSPLVQYPATSDRFPHIHIDIVGPYPSNDDYRYCLTIVDRFTRWPEARPMQDMSARTVGRALISGWIAKFGVPKVITSDQGQNSGRRYLSNSRRHLEFIICARLLAILKRMAWWNDGTEH